jgi:hypothetical protein
MKRDDTFQTFTERMQFWMDSQMTQNLALLAGVMMCRDHELEAERAVSQASLLVLEAKKFVESGLSQIAERQGHSRK